MKVEWAGQHPDEGSIHAWLDGELDATDSALVDEHVRGCAECGARVAEARGLANEHPARKVEPAVGGALPSPEPQKLAAALPDTTAPMRVAAARAALRARTDSATPPADKARVGFSAGAPATLDRITAAGQA